MTRPTVVLTVLLAMSGASSAHADLIITIGNASIPAQGTATIDVFLRAGAATNLSVFAFELSISEPHGEAGLIEFVEPAPDYENDASYVFFANTAGPAGDTAVSSPATQWIGFDEANDPAELNVDQDYLLARLNLQHSSVLPPFESVGQTFTVSLVGDVNTVFYNDQFEEIAFSSFPGAITVVPEPGSFLLIAVAGLCAAPYLRRRLVAKRRSESC